ncbi:MULTISPECIES: phosphotransferase [unclassified Leisingera]|uniref:phosphotransferase n=1 Tax=unclassified Leisingera TaxID=2614906 RepID=UPI00030F544E|nr:MULTISPECIES: phosphotransferase [unclassified Leisingera]KIC24950.1 hypothetical protein RA23_10555 [Leisingera sp. ANG-S3]KIC30658.1 hypothetical protein RA25_18550 [Leisingera sp. ANG-S5]KIC55193.1 hypothetical protein RA22_00050 [Leisingera sp. ANG-S]KID08925.1 hypothetical protein GC1_09435 [Leisingera sp. ANG1]
MTESAVVQDTAEFDERIARIVAQVPGWDDGKATWKWLSGGGAHKNFLVDNGDGTAQSVVKLWNRDWETLGIVPPSAVPMLNTVDAGRAGIGAPVVAIVDDPLALMIEFLPGKPVNLKDPDVLPRVAAKARQLHDSGLNFRRDFNPFAEARVILASAQRADVALPDDYNEILPVLQRIEQALDLRPRDFVPSHNDLYSANLLEQPDGTIRLIDYDLSGNSDRCYDLGLMTTFEDLDSDQVSRLTESYFGTFDRRMRARVEMFAIASDYCQFALFATALAVADMNDDYDYAGFMTQNWSNIQKRTSGAGFGAFLAEV